MLKSYKSILIFAFHLSNSFAFLMMDGFMFASPLNINPWIQEIMIFVASFLLFLSLSQTHRYTYRIKTKMDERIEYESTVEKIATKECSEQSDGLGDSFDDDKINAQKRRHSCEEEKENPIKRNKSDSSDEVDNLLSESEPSVAPIETPPPLEQASGEGVADPTTSHETETEDPQEEIHDSNNAAAEENNEAASPDESETPVEQPPAEQPAEQPTEQPAEQSDEKQTAEEPTEESKASEEATDEVFKDRFDEQFDDKRKVTNLRKNIRDVLNDNQLDATTLAAQRQELERLARVQEQQRNLREVQRQVVFERQTQKAQNRVLSLLQGSHSLLKPIDVDLSGEQPADGEQGESSAKADILTADAPVQLIDITNTGDDESHKTVAKLADGSAPVPILLSEESGDEGVEQKDIVTIIDSSDDDCIILSDEDSEEENDDPHNSGLHVNDTYNIPDSYGNVIINVGHPDDEANIYIAPQIARNIKPHQIGGVRFLFDNIIESVERFKTSTGFGCILAHSMGLGKTLQLCCFCDIFLRHTSSKTVLCIMPINTLQNWLAEFNMWLPDDAEKSPLGAQGEVRPRHFKIFVLNDTQKSLQARAKVVLEWEKDGGVLLIGYELFRLLSLKKIKVRKPRKRITKASEARAEEELRMLDEMYEALVNPGPDLVVCDEGHRIKNSHASISTALKKIRSKRRIVLTGYPLQNNLLEYWCMVDFVRPNYLGTKTEFANMFERPIQNGQCIDSTPQDIKLMRYRAHVLHSLLLGFVQRRSHLVLKSSLPQKEEYVLLVRMTEFQRKLYDEFMNNVVRVKTVPNPLKAFAVCCKIWNHPDVLYNFLKKREADLDLEEAEAAILPIEEIKIPETDKKKNKKQSKTIKKEEGKVEVKTETVETFSEPIVQDNVGNNGANNGASGSNDLNKVGTSSMAETSSTAYSQNSTMMNNVPDPYYSNTMHGGYSAYGHSNYYGYPNSMNYNTADQNMYSSHWSNPSQNYYHNGYQKMEPMDNYYNHNANYYPQSMGYGTSTQQEIKQEPTENIASINQPNAWSNESQTTQQPMQQPMQQPIQQPVQQTVKPEPEVKPPAEPEVTDNTIKTEEPTTVNSVEKIEPKDPKPTKEEGIPYDWAVELMKNYVANAVESSPKMEIFFCILEECVRLGDRMLVFSQSLLTLNLIESFLKMRPTNVTETEIKWYKNINYFRLDGSTTAMEREKLVNEFNSNKEIHLFLVSTRAGSLGINLVGANRVIVFDASWNPCHDTQAVCRVYRYGQQKPCFVYRMVMDNCLEKKIYDRQVNKQGLSDRVVDECNPDAHLSIKEVTSLCYDDDKDDKPCDFESIKENYNDVVMQKVIESFEKCMSKEPFKHETLLVDRKEQKLSVAEKRLAQRGYELEKRAGTKSNYGITYQNRNSGTKTVVGTYNAGGTSVPSPVTSGRPTKWIPPEVWQRQGMSAQVLVLPGDVVIPTNNAEKANIILKEGSKVMILKSPKGIYMQLETGKIIAIKTSLKPDGARSKVTDDTNLDDSIDDPVLEAAEAQALNADLPINQSTDAKPLQQPASTEIQPTKDSSTTNNWSNDNNSMSSNYSSNNSNVNSATSYTNTANGHNTFTPANDPQPSVYRPQEPADNNIKSNKTFNSNYNKNDKSLNTYNKMDVCNNYPYQQQQTSTHLNANANVSSVPNQTQSQCEAPKEYYNKQQMDTGINKYKPETMVAHHTDTRPNDIRTNHHSQQSSTSVNHTKTDNMYGTKSNYPNNHVDMMAQSNHYNQNVHAPPSSNTNVANVTYSGSQSIASSQYAQPYQTNSGYNHQYSTPGRLMIETKFLWSKKNVF